MVLKYSKQGEPDKEKPMLEGGPVGRVERMQQTVTERREEERVLKVESEDNLLDRVETRSVITRTREEVVEETASESSAS
jgi:hypothetical protein